MMNTSAVYQSSETAASCANVWVRGEAPQAAAPGPQSIHNLPSQPAVSPATGSRPSNTYYATKSVPKAKKPNTWVRPTSTLPQHTSPPKVTSAQINDQKATNHPAKYVPVQSPVISPPRSSPKLAKAEHNARVWERPSGAAQSSPVPAPSQPAATPLHEAATSPVKLGMRPTAAPFVSKAVAGPTPANSMSAVDLRALACARLAAFTASKKSGAGPAASEAPTKRVRNEDSGHQGDIKPRGAKAQRTEHPHVDNAAETPKKWFDKAGHCGRPSRAPEHMYKLNRRQQAKILEGQKVFLQKQQAELDEKQAELTAEIEAISAKNRWREEQESRKAVDSAASKQREAAYSLTAGFKASNILKAAQQKQHELENSEAAQKQKQAAAERMLKRKQEGDLLQLKQAALNHIMHASTPWQILKVDIAAAPSEIKRSFQRLSQLVHPDKCHLDGADAAMQRLNAARSRMLPS